MSSLKQFIVGAGAPQGSDRETLLFDAVVPRHPD